MHHLAVTVEPSINGANVIQTRRALERLAGADVVARALASVPADTAEAYTAITPIGWVTVRDVDAVTHAVAALSPEWTAERLAREAARVGVENLVNGLWRVMLRFTSDEALVKRTPLFYSKTFNIGELSSVIPRPGTAELVQSGWPAITELQLAGLGGGIETVIRCAGRKDATVSWTRTSTGARYSARWST